MKVYQAINAVSAELAREGIGKGGKNQQQGYAFRGIDQVMNGLAPVLARNKLIVSPRVISRECEARTTRSGGVLYSVVVMVEFDFISAEDGTKHTACMAGEGMDSADKATNKAMASAYKYVVCQTFCIPLEGSEDADSVTPEDTVMQDTKPAAEPRKSVDPKVVALQKTAEAMKSPPRPPISARARNAKPQVPDGPSLADSAAVREGLLFALSAVKTRADAAQFSRDNGQSSKVWPQMNSGDQEYVLAAVKEKFAEIAAADKASKGSAA